MSRVHSQSYDVNRIHTSWHMQNNQFHFYTIDRYHWWILLEAMHISGKYSNSNKSWNWKKNPPEKNYYSAKERKETIYLMLNLWNALEYPAKKRIAFLFNESERMDFFAVNIFSMQTLFVDIWPDISPENHDSSEFVSI